MNHTILKIWMLILSINIINSSLQAQGDPCFDWPVEAQLIRPGDSPLPFVTNYFGDSIDYYPFCQPRIWADKSVMFLHGLAGSKASWHKPWQYTLNNYWGSSFNLEYTKSENSFDEAALATSADIQKYLIPLKLNEPNRCSNEDYIITHSQGGIVARHLDCHWRMSELDPFYYNTIGKSFFRRGFNGIVTFATPNDGAHIGLTMDQHKNIIQSVISTVVLNDIEELSYDFIETFKLFPKLQNSIISMKSNLDTFIKNQMSPLILSELHPQTLTEMLPNSPLINTLKNYNSRVHRVAFYGIEEAPEIWRVLDMVLNEEPSEADLWMANEDETLMKNMEIIRANHEAEIKEQERLKKINLSKMRSNNIKTYVSAALLVTPAVMVFNLRAKNFKAKAKTNEKIIKNRSVSVDFLNNANTQWRYLIGSYHVDSFDFKVIKEYQLTIGNVVYMKTQDSALALEYYQIFMQEPEYNYKTVLTVTFIPSRERSFFPSDGVVLAKSQVAFPGVKESDTDIMRKNNHFQVRNSSETKRVLENLFEGREYDDFFKLNKK